jgi:hypothetical protein
MNDKTDLKRLQKKYIDFLYEEGYKPVLDDDGYNIMFQFEGMNCALQFDENANNQIICTIACGFRYNFKSDNEKISALLVVNSINKAQRLGKMWMDMEYGSIDYLIAFLLVKEDDLKIFFEDYCRNIRGIFDAFEQRIEELNLII